MGNYPKEEQVKLMKFWNDGRLGDALVDAGLKINKDLLPVDGVYASYENWEGWSVYLVLDYKERHD